MKHLGIKKFAFVFSRFLLYDNVIYGIPYIWYENTNHLDYQGSETIKDLWNQVLRNDKERRCGT